MGLFVPKPSTVADCQGCGSPDLGTIVRQCALTSAGGDDDRYSLGYSVAYELMASCTATAAGPR
jgi:hypothetical protein